MSLKVGSFIKHGEDWLRITKIILVSVSLSNLVYFYDGVFISDEEKKELENEG